VRSGDVQLPVLSVVLGCGMLPLCNLQCTCPLTAMHNATRTEAHIVASFIFAFGETQTCNMFPPFGISNTVPVTRGLQSQPATSYLST